MWVSYSDYTTEYMGSLLSAGNFPKYSQAGQDYIEYITMSKAVQAMNEEHHVDKIKRAVCVVAELLYERDEKLSKIKASDSIALDNNIKSESVKSHSVTYKEESKIGTKVEIEKEYDKLVYSRVRHILMTTGLLYRGI